MRTTVLAGALTAALVTGIAVPRVSAQTPGPPVAINACGPILVDNSTQTLFGIPVTSTSGGIQIQFTNESSKTANLINFTVDSNGESFVIRDVGTFSPNIEITHKYSNGAGQAFVLPALVAPKISCHVQSVGFTDGTTWRHGDAGISPPASPSMQALSATPASVTMDRNAESHLFMVMAAEAVAAFTERDTCAQIANVKLSASGEAAATYVVTPIVPGTCSAVIRDQYGHTVVVPITVR